MLQFNPLPTKLLIVAIVLLLASCNSQRPEIPFPESDSAFTQPKTVPLVLSAPKKINWVTVRSGGIHPEVRKLDLADLPSTTYDSVGFNPLVNPPDSFRFDFNSLPQKPLDLDKIPSKPLALRTSLLNPPVVTKAGTFIPKQGTPLSILDIDGFTEKTVRCIYKDHKGFMWIVSDKFLSRYDGEYISSYKLPSNRVVSLMEDNQGRLWYTGLDNTGMIDFDHGTISTSNRITIPPGVLSRIILDHTGALWITQTSNRTAEMVDPDQMTYKTLDETTGLSGTNRRSVYEDENRNIWIGTNAGINILNTEKSTIRYLTKKEGLPQDTVHAIIGDKKGRLWMGFKYGGIYELNMNSGVVRVYGKQQGINTSVVFNLARDHNDRIWIGSDVGLFIVDIHHQAFKYFREKEGIPEIAILDLFEDDVKRMWVGSFSGGLSIVGEDAKLTRILVNKQLSTTLEDSKGNLWLGGSSGGIDVVNVAKNKIATLTTDNGLAYNFVQNVMEVNGKIWIATNSGFNIYDPVAKSIMTIGKEQGLVNDTIYGMHGDVRGNTWFVGPGLGINRIDSTRSKIERAGSQEGLSDDAIIDIRSDKQGNIWVANLYKGIDVIDPVNGTVRNLSKGPGLEDTCNRILLPDNLGRMWIGTDKGVYIADINKGTLINISITEGLCDNYVTSLLHYKGKVVVGTKHKVSIITLPETEAQVSSNKGWKVDLLSGSEGLTNVSQSWSCNLVTSDGRYIWAEQGATIINSIQPDNRPVPPTYVTGISILNEFQRFTKPVEFRDKDTLWKGDQFFLKEKDVPRQSFAQEQGLSWDSLQGPYNMPVNLVIPHDLNFLQFHFAQMNLGSREPVMYSYILEGVDKKWSTFSPKTITENYMNLASGDYVFKVRSQAVNGQWSKPALLKFTILAPWWQQWWMYVIYALGIVGVIVGYNKYRSVALTRENRLLEDRVAARTREVKQQAEELTTINAISQALVSQADLNELIQLVGNQLRDLFNANIVYIALLDKKTQVINFPYQYGDDMKPIKLGEGLTSKIILSGKPLLINSKVDEKRSELGVNRVGKAAASYLGVPIPVSDEIIGVLSIQSTQTENTFKEKDQNLLSTIAANVGVAIRKARLFEEVKQANTEADAARKTAEQANAAKSAFLSTVSHELRTPLTSVLGFAKITKKRLEEKIFPITDKSDPKTAKTIEQISGNLNVVIAEGERLTNLINDVLDLAKIEAGKMEWNNEPVNIPEIVERAIASTSSLFEQKNLHLDRKIATDLPEITGDRDKLIQVVVNLLSNAVKFTNTGTVTCSVFQQDGGIVVGITDTGIGIALEDYDKVFEQFKQVGDTLTDKPKGTGLGLPICKEIVEHHGGKIWLESKLGTGSTFYFMLPLAKQVEKAGGPIQLNDLLQQLKTQVAQSHPSIQKENATILVVDDDEGIRSLLKQELGEAGYSIEEASNGKEALAKIRALRPNLIILDVMMPEMNGFDVAAILKNDPQTMDIPIIILSIVQDKSRGFRIGVDRYLTKPIDTDLLFSEIGHLLEQGKSKKRVMVVDEDSVVVRSLADVLQAKGYQVVESDGKEMVEKAISTQPDIIILNSVISDRQEIVKSLRFEKGLENVLFLIYQ